MKFNFITKQEHELKDYQNILLDKENSSLTPWEHCNCYDGEATEIRIEYAIEQLQEKDHEAAIQFWIKKLRLGGKLTIIGTELYMIIKRLINREMTVSNFNEILNNCSALTSISEIEQLMLENQLKIQTKKLIDMSFCIVGEKI